MENNIKQEINIGYKRNILNINLEHLLGYYYDVKIALKLCLNCVKTEFAETAIDVKI